MSSLSKMSAGSRVRNLLPVAVPMLVSGWSLGRNMLPIREFLINIFLLILYSDALHSLAGYIFTSAEACEPLFDAVAMLAFAVGLGADAKNGERRIHNLVYLYRSCVIFSRI